MKGHKTDFMRISCRRSLDIHVFRWDFNLVIELATCFVCLMKSVSFSYLTGYDISKHWGYVGKSSFGSRRYANLSEWNQWGFYPCSKWMEKIAGTIARSPNPLNSFTHNSAGIFHMGGEIQVQRFLFLFRSSWWYRFACFSFWFLSAWWANPYPCWQPSSSSHIKPCKYTILDCEKLSLNLQNQVIHLADIAGRCLYNMIFHWDSSVQNKHPATT